MFCRCFFFACLFLFFFFFLDDNKQSKIDFFWLNKSLPTRSSELSARHRAEQQSRSSSHSAELFAGRAGRGSKFTNESRQEEDKERLQDVKSALSFVSNKTKKIIFSDLSRPIRIIQPRTLRRVKYPNPYFPLRKLMNCASVCSLLFSFKIKFFTLISAFHFWKLEVILVKKKGRNKIRSSFFKISSSK